MSPVRPTALRMTSPSWLSSDVSTTLTMMGVAGACTIPIVLPLARRGGLHLFERGPVFQDAGQERFGDLLAIGGLRQQAGLLAVGDEGDFREHAGHRRADKDHEGRLLDAQILQQL